MFEQQLASIDGRVVAADAQRPLPRVRVQLVSTDPTVSSSTLTDATGAFEFTNLRAGRYWLRAESENWLTTYFGQRSPSDPPQPVVLASGDHLEGAEIVLSALAVISGRVLDATGSPVERAHVSVMGADLRMAVTNDLGEFRVPRLPPGRYAVWVIPPGSFRGERRDDDIYGLTVARSSDDPVQVVSGEFPIGDIVLAPAQLRVISGTVYTSNGLPAASAEVSMAVEQSGGRTTFSADRDVVTTDASGEFRFLRVPEGRYRLRARSGDQVGMADVVVAGGPVEGITMVLQPSTSLIGHLRFEPAVQGTCRGSVTVVPLEAFHPEDRQPRTAPVEPDGSFSSSRLWGRVRFVVSCHGSGVAPIRHLAVNRRDVHGDTIDLRGVGPSASVSIVASPPSNRVVGTVTDSRGRPEEGLAVLAIDDPDAWKRPNTYLWSTRIVNGGFQLEGLPAGRYLIFHEPPRRASELESPEYLHMVRARAQSVQVPTTGEVSVTLRSR